MAKIEVPGGLENVVVASTSISLIEGGPDRLLYRGYAVQELAHLSNYEEVSFLVLEGHLPTSGELEEFSKRVRRHRKIPEARVDLLRHLPREMRPVDAMVAMLAFPEGKDSGPPLCAWDDGGLAGRLLSETPTVAANFERLRNGQGYLEPRNDLDSGASFLYLLRGQVPSPEEARAMDQTFLLHADNELNTATFAARVAASTGADMVSAVTSALCTLKGPLHGGASVAVARQVREIGSPDRAEDFVARKFAAGERITGFGHRVYRQEDPRATVLREIARELSERKRRPEPFATLRALEVAVKKRKALPVNLDLYSACVFMLLDIPPDLFTPVFAIGRMPGWVAHIQEEYSQRKLVSPIGRYSGPDFRTYVPITQRS